MIRAIGPMPRIEITMEEVTDPVEVAKARAQRERAERNWAWHQAHIVEIGNQYRGKHICISNEQLFVADTLEEVLALAKAAHPEDDGRIFQYIPRERMVRIYANQWTVAGLSGRRHPARDSRRNLDQ